jgi:hypothetical protein
MIAPRIAAEHLHRAAIGLEQPDENPHRCRLPGAVGPEKATDLARMHREINVLEGHVLTEPLCDAPHGNGGLHVHIMRFRAAAGVGCAR